MPSRREAAGGEAVVVAEGARACRRTSARGCMSVRTDGSRSITGKAEVGQNIRTSLTQAVAEELHVAPGSIHLVMADTQLTPFDMGTFGSRTTPDMSRRLRRAAAAAREVLIDFAAEVWKTDRSLLSAANGAIVNTKTKESLEFGKLTQGRKLTKTVADDSPTSTPAEMDDRRPFGGQSRWPFVRYWQASICVRHPASGDVVRQGLASADDRRRPWHRSTQARPRQCLTLSWFATAILSVSLRPAKFRLNACVGGDQGGVETRPQDFRQATL